MPQPAAAENPVPAVGMPAAGSQPDRFVVCECSRNLRDFGEQSIIEGAKTGCQTKCVRSPKQSHSAVVGDNLPENVGASGPRGRWGSRSNGLISGTSRRVFYGRPPRRTSLERVLAILQAGSCIVE